jgi:hypothetical protein
MLDALSGRATARRYAQSIPGRPLKSFHILSSTSEGYNRTMQTLLVTTSSFSTRTSCGPTVIWAVFRGELAFR